MKYLLLMLVAVLMAAAQPVRASDAVLPGAAFPAARYEVLWKKSPFQVATAEAVQESPDYMLVGFAAKIDGISYASLVERQNNEHFLISTDKPTRGLTLTSLTRSQDGTDTYATVLKDGQSITLKLEKQPDTLAEAQPNMPQVNPLNNAVNVNQQMVPQMIPQMVMPGASYPGTLPSRPFPTRFHRPLIHLPPPPVQQPQPVQPASAPQ